MRRAGLSGPGTPAATAAGSAEGAETVLGFDFGSRRIGVAIGNTFTGNARPLKVIDAVPIDKRYRTIAELLAEWRPDRLVVGRPLDEDGAVSELTRLADKFSNQLHGRFGLPIARVDERYTSRDAQAIIASAGGRRNAEDDGVAAALILSQYLDEARRSTGPHDGPDPASEDPPR